MGRDLTSWDRAGIWTCRAAAAGAAATIAAIATGVPQPAWAQLAIAAAALFFAWFAGGLWASRRAWKRYANTLGEGWPTGPPPH